MNNPFKSTIANIIKKRKPSQKNIKLYTTEPQYISKT